MSLNNQYRRFVSSTSHQHDASYVGENGELTWDTTNGLRLHDGSTQGGNVIGGSSGEGTTYLDYGNVDSGSGNMTINRNYKYHWLVNLSGNPSANRRYYLENGNDGDVFYFMPSTPFDPTNTTMWVDSISYNANGTFGTGSANVQMFSTTVGSTETLIRATWFNGSWHFNGPVTIL